jgi:predicted homoserine dehydrogenase-like protein
MEKWAEKFGNRVRQVVANTDGTKVHIEQALVANGLGATFAGNTLRGPRAERMEDAGLELAKLADELGAPIADYVLAPSGGGAVFIVARHESAVPRDLEYYKLGNGPYYVLVRPFHLCHLEISKTVLNVLERPGYYVFNNGASPIAQVVAIAKRDIAPGETIAQGVGGFDVRGEARKIVESLDCVPIGLLDEARVVHGVKAGDIIRFTNVELPKSRALAIWMDLLHNKTYRT